MKTKNNYRLLTVIIAVLLMLSALCGCQKKKKFDTPEAMVSEMTGVYSGSDAQSGQRIIIDGNNIIKFNIDDLFREITDDDFFWENFPSEDWSKFDIEILLQKPYVEISKSAVSINVKKSKISGYWLNGEGILFSEEGYPLNKISSDPTFPSMEMIERFEEYQQYLQEYEIASIVIAANDNLEQEQKELETALKYANTPISSARKSTASADTIADCAFDSLMDSFKYPRTASMDGYSRTPQYDSYGRVCTLITVTCQNGFGNYITEDVYVVLQSCTASGYYTYNTVSHYTKNEDYLSFLLTVNDWDEDPEADDEKEGSYKEAIKLIENRKYQSALDKLDELGDYKYSKDIMKACTDIMNAEKYKTAVSLYTNGQYTKANDTLFELLKDCGGDYLNAKRVIKLCNANVENETVINNSESVNDTISETQPEETLPVEVRPLNSVPYAVSLSATEAIYTEPDENSRFVQKVGEKGIYTIVEEEYDYYGNLWGRLKSGLGWVLLSDTYEENARPPQGKSLEELLDTSKVWKTSFDRRSEGYVATFQYVFEGDGTCYMLMSAGFEPWDGGIGTYEVSGNTIKFSILLGGKTRYTYSYTFDPDTYMLTQSSGNAIFSDYTAGTKTLLEMDDSNPTTKIKSIAQRYIDSSDNT